MKKRFMLAILVMTFSFALSACGDSSAERLEGEVSELSEQVETLTQENASLTEENQSLTNEIDSLKGQAKASDSALISTIFWRDGKTYYVDNCQFYSDCFCSKPVDSTNLRFYSPIVLRIQLSNGNNAYFTLSNGGIVWSVDKPYFDEVELDE